MRSVVLSIARQKYLRPPVSSPNIYKFRGGFSQYKSTQSKQVCRYNVEKKAWNCFGHGTHWTYCGCYRIQRDSAISKNINESKISSIFVEK